MRDDARLGYFPPGEKFDENVTKRGGADPYGYFPPKKTPSSEPKPAPEHATLAEAFDSVAPGVCPYCAKSFVDTKNPAASLSAHIRAKVGKDSVHVLSK